MSRVRPNELIAAALLGALICGGSGCKPTNSQPEATFELKGEPIAPPVETKAASARDTTNSTPATNVVAASTEPVNAPPTTAVATKADSTAAGTSENPTALSFQVLAGYTINIPDEMVSAPLATVTNKMRPEDLIPDNVRKLNDTCVTLQGFMLPLKVEGGLVTELLLMKDQSMCCYGTVPKINEWVSVRVQKPGVKPIMDVPVTMHGTLHVGAMLDNGYLVGIYSMDGQKMSVAE